MSTTIDERIVEMRFDNKQFESNVQTSISSIDRLKKGLNFEGAARGLDDIEVAARRCDMSTLIGAVENIGSKFTAMGVVGVTAVQDLYRTVKTYAAKLTSSITAGFQEYETQTNAVQTILSNTQSKQKTVAKNALESVEQTSAQTVASVRNANQKSVDDLQDVHRQKIREFEKLADEEIKIAEDSYEQQSEALEEAIEAESDALKQAHKEKLDLYHEEYMEKLKAIDEERYNQLKVIDDQINKINDRTKAEDRSLKKKRQEERISELRERVRTANSLEDRLDSEKRLNDYLEEVDRERVIEQRKKKIESLESQKDTIKEQYDLQEQQLKIEYDEKVEQEKELYDEASKTLKKEHDHRKKALKETYDYEKDLLKEQQREAKEAIQDLQREELASLRARNDAAISYIQDQKKAASGAVEFETEFVEGSTLQDVNRALDELNEYADRTIYNFTEMTRNIGTFTAAGIDLDTSVNAIKGIANLAAVSGATSQQASTAMYQLSQALSSGTVRLMDWNSVVNAGMGGQVFQDALKETAKVMGISIDEIIAKNGSFRESLQEGWLTAEVLTETLAKFTGDLSAEQLKQKGYTEEQIQAILKLGQMANDAATKVKTFTQLMDTLKEAAQSGWAKTWQILIGDFGEAKNLFTELSDILGNLKVESALSRNQMLMRNFSSGWKQLLSKGIADEEGFKEALISVAKETNPEIEKMIETQGSLEATFQNGWVTADVLAKSIESLAAKTKGMADEQLENLGYTRKQIDELEEFNESIQNGSISLDEFAAKMAKPSGRENLVDALISSLKGAINIFKMVKDAFKEIFPTKDAEGLYKITERIKEITNSFLVFTRTVASNNIETPFSNLKRVFRGLFAAVDIVLEPFRALFRVLTSGEKTTNNFGEKILSTAAKVGDWIVALRDAIKEGDKFFVILSDVSSFLKGIIDKITEVVSSLLESVGLFNGISLGPFNKTIDGAVQIMNPFSKIGEVFKNVFDGIKKAWDAVQPTFQKIGDAISKFFAPFLSGMKKALEGADINDIILAITDILGGGLILTLTGLVSKMKKSMGGIEDILKSASKVLDSVSKVLDGVRGCLKAYQNEINARALLKIAFAVALLAGAIIALTFVDQDALLKATGAITSLFLELIIAMGVLGKISGKASNGNVELMKLAAVIVAISFSVLILAGAIKKLEGMKSEELLQATIAISVLVAEMVGAMKIMSDNIGDITSGAIGAIALAFATMILARVVKNLGELDISTSIRGLFALELLLLELAGFVKMLPSSSTIVSVGVGLVILSGALLIFTKVIRTLGNMDMMVVIRGLGAMGGALLILAIALHSLPSTTLSKGAGLMLVATSLAILGRVLGSLGSMSWEEIAKSLVTLGGAMLILALGLNKMAYTMSGSTALMVAAIAIAMLVPSLFALGALKWESILKSLVTLAGVFVVLGVAGFVLQFLAPVILQLGAALALVGVGVFAIGAGLLIAGLGLTALSVGLSAFAAAGAIAVTAIMATFAGLLVAIKALLPLIFDILGDLIVNLARFIERSAPAIGLIIKALVLVFVDVLITCVPELIKGALILLMELFKNLAEYAPQIAGYVFDFFINVFNVFAEKIPDLVYAISDVIQALFGAISEVIRNADFDALKEGLIGIGMLAAIIVALAAIALLTPVAMIGVLGMWAIAEKLALMLADLGAMSQIPGLKWFIAEGGDILQAVGTAIGQFIGGVVGGIASGVASQFPKIAQDMSDFMNNLVPFLNGLALVDSSMLESAKNLVAIMLMFTAANLIEGLTSWLVGKSSMTEFGAELSEFGPYFYKYYESIKDIDPNVVTASSNAAKALSEMATNLPNSGGLAGKIFGENSLAQFANELANFGPSLMAYAESVEGLDGDVVVNSTKAATAIAEFATKLPPHNGIAQWIMGDNSLTRFAAELSTFGPSLLSYSNSVAGIDADVVINSVRAAEALNELVNKLPDKDGFVQAITGSKSLTKFAAELSAFAPELVNYAESVTGLKVSAITNSTEAIQGLVKMAKDLPDQGGLKSIVFGDATLAKFGEELVKFGSKLRDYEDKILDIDMDNLVASLYPISLIFGIAKELPNSGGLAAVFAGENGLGAFGKELATFSKYYKDFANNIVPIDKNLLTEFVESVHQLHNMQETLSKDYNILSGKVKLDTFGQDLSKLGGHLSKYYKDISKIDRIKIDETTDNIQTIIKAFRNVDAKSLNQMTKFSDALRTVGETGAKDFIFAITDAEERIKASAKKFIDYFISGLNANKNLIKQKFEDIIKSVTDMFTKKQEDFKVSARDLIYAFKNGISASTTEVENVMSSIIEDALEVVKKKYEEGRLSGVGLMDKIIEGLRYSKVFGSKDMKDNHPMSSALHSITISALNKLNERIDSFTQSGIWFVDGLVRGLRNKDANVKLEEAAAALGDKVSDSVDTVLKVNSPSKVAQATGKYFVLGLIKGLGEYTNKVKNASANLANDARIGLASALSKAYEMLTDDGASEPTIRPVLDLTEIQNGTVRLNRMLSSAPEYPISGTIGLANQIANDMNKNISGNASSSSSTTMDFFKRMLQELVANPSKIENIFNIQGENPQEIAEEVSRELQRQVERREASWA